MANIMKLHSASTSIWLNSKQYSCYPLWILPLLSKERNWTEGIRMFLVCLSAGKLKSIYQHLFFQPHGRRWIALFVPSQTMFLCWTGLTPYCLCFRIHYWLTELSLDGSLLMNSNESSVLPRGTVKSSEHNSKLQIFQGAESILHCSMKIKNISQTHKDSRQYFKI